MSKTSEEIRFRGYASPNYTMVPDELFDEQLPYLSGAEVKVLLYIMRRTFGFKKSSDNISFSQICTGITTREGKILDRGTGLSRSTAQVAIKGLADKNLIHVTRRSSLERGFEATTYSLNLVTAPYAENRHSPMAEIDPALDRKSVRQKKDQQETVLQETDKISNTPDSVRLFRSAHAHESVENSENHPDNGNGKGGRPPGRRPQNPITPAHTNANHDVPPRLADPTGREESRQDPKAQPVVGKHRRGSPGASHDAADAAFRASAAYSTIAAVDPIKAAQTSQHRGTSRDTDASAETVSQATMPHGVASIGSVLTGRGEAQTIATRQEGPKSGRIAASGTEIPDHPETSSEAHPGRATGPSYRWRRIAVPDYIKHVVTDFSAELHDDEHTRANLSRATRLWQHSGLEEPVFVQEVLYKARAIARKQSGVKKRNAAGGLVNRMPYFFAVVEDLLGLRESAPRGRVEA